MSPRSAPRSWAIRAALPRKTCVAAVVLRPAALTALRTLVVKAGYLRCSERSDGAFGGRRARLNQPQLRSNEGNESSETGYVWLAQWNL